MLKSKRQSRAAKAARKQNRQIVVQKVRAPSGRGLRGIARRAADVASIQSPAYELACSTVNPWACTTCIPDGSSGSGCFSTKKSFQIATGVGGSCGAVFWQSDVSSQSLEVNNSTAATFTVASSWTAAQSYSTISALYAACRPVSSGLRCTYVGPTQTDGGILLIGQVSGKVPPSSFSSTTLSSASLLCMNYSTFPIRNGGQITFRSGDIEDLTNWKELESPDITTGGGNYPYLVAIVFGAAASQSVMQVEAITNFEGRYKNATFLAGGVNTGKTSPTEIGWYEKMKYLVNKLPQILPLLSAGISGYESGGLVGGAMGVLGTLSNGLPAPGVLSSTRMIPRTR